MIPAQAQRSVGRPREFDKDTALESVMNVFWCKGHEATSLADLCACTGLHKGSLYRAFGDKHQLFLRALRHYAEVEFRAVMAVATHSDSALANLKAAVRKICADAGQDKGCLMINSLVELAPHDPEVKAALNSFGEKRLRALTDLIGAARQAGEIRRELEPRKLARQLMMTLAGSAAMAKGFLSRKEITETLDDLVDSWT